MLKKNLTIALASLVILISPSYAKKVDQPTAVKVAKNFYYERAAQHYPVSYEAIRSKAVTPVTVNASEVYYIINFEGNGWVVVSAEDAVQPVLAYSFEGSYVVKDQPAQVTYWMGLYQGQIMAVREKNIEADAGTSQEWDRLSTDSPSQLKAYSTDNVEPLTVSSWDQGKWYNELCPKDAGGDAGHVPTGCIATSMAQIMFYWRYPAQGNGSHNYIAAGYGIQSANFNVPFHWTGMMNSLGSNSFEVAQLMYFCGVSVNMNYGAQGSGAQTEDVPNSLVAYFKYAPVCQHKKKSDYTTPGAWESLLTSELNQKRPLIYHGFPAAPGTGAGHAWVCDGYQGTTYFHFNWGWSGMDNGYFYLNNLAPPSAGTNFNAEQGAVINIYPPSASYPANCSGQQVITDSKGTIEDGSGPIANYQPNSNCSWLINPADSVTSITLTFEKMNTDTNDVVKVYAGATTADPLLGTYSGSVVPAAITATGSRMLITFSSNASIESEGWYAHYTCSYPQLCHGTTLSDPTGTLSDGSGTKNYLANTLCTFSIMPNNNPAIVTLEFTEFDTEPTSDYVRVYDLVAETLLATYSGHSIPGSVTSPSGQMYIEFRSDGLRNFGGWTAHYTTFGVGIDSRNFLNNLRIYPNPASDELYVKFETPKPQSLQISLNSLDGKSIYTESVPNLTGSYDKQIELKSFAKGIYFLRLKGDNGTVVRKVVIQ